MYFKGENFAIYHGDNRQILPTLAENSIDAIVTDPPYELGFMGKSWDASGVAFDPATWREALRVLKPGGHLIAFSGSRTYHRMAVAIEDAGFEIRDQIMWIYGSGFPKSHNISKGIDKSENKEVWENNNYGGGNSKCEQCGKWIISGSPCQCPKAVVEFKSDEAKQWDGWGTALKPAHEPMVLARKPLVGTVAANVLTYGTGGLNIDGARVGSEVIKTNGRGSMDGTTPIVPLNPNFQGSQHTGRWPANVIHDGSDEVVALFPDTGKSGVAVRRNGNSAKGMFAVAIAEGSADVGFRDSGSAARFFYCAKASKRDRNEGLDGFEAKITNDNTPPGSKGSNSPRAGAGRGGATANHHPTVKPTDLMRYLCRLITPPNGTVLDPFMGSGSTGKAAMYEGFKFIGIEMTDEYLPIAKARIEFAVSDNEGFLL